MSGLKPYTDEQTYTTPASLEAMARKLDEIDHHVRASAATAREARDFAKESRDFAVKLVTLQALPKIVKIAAMVGGSAIGGGIVSLAFHLLTKVVLH
jgi:hypothetical protein